MSWPVTAKVSSRWHRYSCTTLLLVPCLVSCSHDAQPLPTEVRAGEPSLESEPLQTAGGNGAAAGEGRFQRLSADRTGIDFVHVWAPPEDRQHSLDNAFAGGGVCMGDYDDDGLLDLYLTRPQRGNRLYKNCGDFRFEDVTGPAGLEDETLWGSGATFADVDNDGDLDLYACCFDGPNRLFINNGDGTFGDAAAMFGLDFKGASVMMAFADYDLDGDLDGYLLTNRVTKPFAERLQKIRWKIRDGRAILVEGDIELKDVILRPDGRVRAINAGQFDRLYRNNGDGTFSDVSQKAGIYGNYVGLSATWWDYNDDGYPDLYVANDFETPDQFYRNNGDGTFTNVIKKTMPHTPWFSMGADFADLNNDGHLDFMASDMSGTTHFKQKVSMGDMEDLGWFLEYPSPRQYMRNAVYLNSGTDRFMEVAHLTGLDSTDWTWSVKLADLDGDGRVDVFVTNGMTRDWFDSDLRKPFAKDPETAFDKWLMQPKRSEANLAFRNQGDLKFEPVSTTWGLDHVGVSFGAACGDLDRDGDLDVVVNNFDEPVSVYRNDLASGNHLLVRLQGTRSNSRGLGANLTAKTPDGIQKRYLTLSRGFMSANGCVAHFGLGRHNTVESLTVVWPSGVRQTLKELPAGHLHIIREPTDGKTVEVEQHTPAALFKPASGLEMGHRERPYNDFQRQPLLPNRLSQLGPGMAWGDVDGDGDEDLYLGAAAGQTASIHFNRGDGSFRQRAGQEKQFAEERECEDMAPLFFDADADGDLDLYVVSGGVECQPNDPVLRDRLYINDGQGNFQKAAAGTLPDLTDSGSVVTANDFDRDGDLDLFVGGRVVPGRYPLPPNSRLLINDAGRFVDATDELAPGLRRAGLVTSAIWSDVDNDGRIDLLVTYEWGPVRLWHWEDGQLVDRTVECRLDEWLGWWNGIAARDVDGDGDMDYAVTNFGLNTKYHATRNNPTLLYYGDIEGNEQLRMIEADYEGDVVFPVRGRSCSSQAMPFLSEKFTSFKEFASASLAEIYTADRLSRCSELAVNTLESGLFLNDGKGGMTFSPLPRLAQVSPGFGVVFTEVDGDGNADLYIVQNFFSPQRETGRMDGGLSLLLLGDGTGNFIPVMPNQSGLVVPGDASGLSTTDLNADGWPDFVVSVNNGKVVAFEHQGSSTGRVVQVRLRGRKENPSGIGARVTLRLEDGSTQTAEVHAGGSYLSQSTSSLVFGLRTRIREITVRWPDGTLSADSPPPSSSSLTIEQPGT